MASFSDGLRESGYVVEKNVVVEVRYGAKNGQEFSRLIAELLSLKVALILTVGDDAPKTVQEISSTVPILAISDDLLGSGLITTLSRPGGNTTGITIQSPELSAKRLELLTRILPGISRVAAIWDPTTGVSQVSRQRKRLAASKSRFRCWRFDDVRTSLVPSLRRKRRKHKRSTYFPRRFSPPFPKKLWTAPPKTGYRPFTNGENMLKAVD
jgi:putative ABC transport system substrate-binding protein